MLNANAQQIITKKCNKNIFQLLKVKMNKPTWAEIVIKDTHLTFKSFLTTSDMN